jgi:hypothetical protein
MYINDGGEVRVAGSQEFFDRPDAMPGFEEAYGFELTADQKVALATGDTAVTERAAAEGTDGVNAAMAYGTDGTIAALDLVVLEDPLGAQPIYQPAPIFREEIIDEYPMIPGCPRAYLRPPRSRDPANAQRTGGARGTGRPGRGGGMASDRGLHRVGSDEDHRSDW